MGLYIPILPVLGGLLRAADAYSNLFSESNNSSEESSAPSRQLSSGESDTFNSALSIFSNIIPAVLAIKTANFLLQDCLLPCQTTETAPSTKVSNEVIGESKPPQSTAGGPKSDPSSRQWMHNAILTNSVLQYCQVGPDFDSCVQRQESYMPSWIDWLNASHPHPTQR